MISIKVLTQAIFNHWLFSIPGISITKAKVLVFGFQKLVISQAFKFGLNLFEIDWTCVNLTLKSFRQPVPPIGSNISNKRNLIEIFVIKVRMPTVIASLNHLFAKKYIQNLRNSLNWIQWIIFWVRWPIISNKVFSYFCCWWEFLICV